jgi:hypothetical protein
MSVGLKDAMASAVLKDVLARPEEYPQTIASTDLNIDLAQYEGTDEKGLPSNKLALDKAEAEGLRVVYPTEKELQIDIDNEQSYLFFLDRKNLVHRFIGIEDFQVSPSKSGLPRRHITVRLKTPVTVLERICLQACLGSDRVREVLGYVRYKHNDPSPTLFFEKKES